jgi:hypothetical protein
MFAALTARRQRYLIAKVDTSTGVERITRTLEWDASPARVRELIDDADADGWDHGVLVLDPEPGTRIYVLPHLDGVIARWDELVRAHRERQLLDLARQALAAMGHGPDSNGDADVLARWLAAGANDDLPPPGPTYVPAARTPVTDAEWFGMERRAQLLARVLPVARELDGEKPTQTALQIAVGLLGH